MKPELAVWQGPPSRAMIETIHLHTHVDSEGKRFFRDWPGALWRTLRTDADFARLNSILDKYRVTL